MHYRSYLIGTVLAGCLGLAWADAAPPMTEQEHGAARDRIAAQEKAEARACKRLKGNARDICHAQAQGQAKVARARLDAQYAPGPEAEQQVKYARADAEYAIARERCDDARRDARSRCLRQAKEAREALERHAKVEKVQRVRQLAAARAREERKAAGADVRTQ